MDRPFLRLLSGFITHARTRFAGAVSVPVVDENSVSRRGKKSVSIFVMICIESEISFPEMVVFMKTRYARLDMDETDLKMLRILQDEGRLSNSELAERVSLSASPCWKRLKRLEAAGVIRGYQAILDRHILGLGIVAFVSILLDNHTEMTCRTFESGVLAMPEVIACHNITGQHDYLLQVLAEDMESYSAFVLNRLRTLPGVKEMHSSFSLLELKSSSKMCVRQA
jgi:Lrp/AsnC family leucine-responsive transcriptional regulator